MPHVYELLSRMPTENASDVAPNPLITQSPHKMASRFEISQTQPRRFEQARAMLGDRLVGVVLPRAQANGWHAAQAPNTKVSDLTRVMHRNNGEATAALLSLTETQQRRHYMKRPYGDLTDSRLPALRSSDVAWLVSSVCGGAMDPNSDQEKEEPKRKRRKSATRREQCRANQARYRNKQRNLQSQLETSVQQLRQELDRLKRQRQDVLLTEKADQSPWTIVAEVFRIIENSFRSPWNLENEVDMQNDIETRRSLMFLQKEFTSDVTVGELSGINELIQQWRRCSQYFGDARLQLQRVESVAPGVITARARLRVAVTELTLRYTFPHIVDVEQTSKYDVHPSLRDRLLREHLDCSISVDFLFDNENGRVSRLEPRIDLMPELFRVLGKLGDVSAVSYSEFLPSDGTCGLHSSLNPAKQVSVNFMC